MESSAAVRARGLGKQFAPGAGVEGIELEIEPGTIFGFIGPSGSGKTTTIRLLTGVTAPDTGEVTVMGKSPAAFSREDRARIGYMPQLSVLYNQLTIWQNMTFAASIFGMPRGRRRRRIVEELEAVELTEATHRKLGKASGGMQRRVALAATLVHDPELLFLDEPTAGIDPLLRRKIWDRLESLRDQGRTIFVTTQYVGEAAHCDRVGVLAEGRLVAVDTPDGLRKLAYGGEVLDVVFTAPIGADRRDQLVAACQAIRIENVGTTGVRLIVVDAGEASPAVVDWATAADLTIQSIEPYLPRSTTCSSRSSPASPPMSSPSRSGWPADGRPDPGHRLPAQGPHGGPPPAAHGPDAHHRAVPDPSRLRSRLRRQPAPSRRHRGHVG